jgi:hypothetical protein
MEHVWYLSIATTTLQAALSVWLLHREFGKRLTPLRDAGVPKHVEAEPEAPPARLPA